MEFREFILAHDSDDLGALALARDRYDFEDFDLALTTLECRRKLRDKVPQWYAVPSLRFPFRLSAEQCSSTETALYKAALVLTFDGLGYTAGAKSAPNAAAQYSTVLNDLKNSSKCSCGVLRIADLTGGLGVDSWAFSKVASEVLYNEMQTPLADAARHNFQELGVKNIVVRNCAVVPGPVPVIPGSSIVIPDSSHVIPSEASVSQILGDFKPTVIYLDPARRSSDGRKVFRLEDCQPNVLELLPELFAAAPFVLLKLSPMADITLVCKQLGSVRAVHVVAAGGECKELLLMLERGYEGEYDMYVYESGAVMQVLWRGDTTKLSLRDPSHGKPWAPPSYPVEGGQRFCGITPPQKPNCHTERSERISYLFEPGKGLLKAGAFELPCEYGLEKLGKHTHLYVGDAVPEELRPFGKCFDIIELLPLNNKSIKELGARYPQAEVTARNVPLTSDELRRKLGCRSGGQVHIFGVHIDACGGNYLVVAK